MALPRNQTTVDWLAIWILFSAWASLSGWCLGLAGWLNPGAISIAYALFFGGLLYFRSHLVRTGGPTIAKILRSRFGVPKIWLALTALALIGAITHTPNNYDYLTYRFPRVLYWTWEHKWYWVPTINQRINYSGTGFEWLMVPVFVLLKTDRLFFLFNFISYLFLPGLIFSVFSQLGISKRICWWWMWVFPCGYCYILQAASAGNDSFAATYLLAALYYLYQEKNAPSVKNLALSTLAIALVTGAKASNLPLVLPWLVVLFFHRKNFLEHARTVVIALIFLVSATVSFLPMAILNIHFTGDFAGDPTNRGRMKESNPVSGMLGNSLQLAKDNLAPTLSPRPLNWNPLEPSFLIRRLERDFPRLDLHSGELQIEEQAGVGLGIVLFAGLFLIGGVQAVTRKTLVAHRSRQALWVVGAGIVAWLGYMTKMGSEATSRLIAAYYPLLVAGILVLVSLDGRIMRRSLFQWIGLIAMLSAFPLVILSPARPLFPIQAVAGVLTAMHVPAGIIERYHEVYSVYAARSFEFQALLSALPPDERTLGFLQSGDDTEVSLWRPFGSRKIVEVMPKDTREEIEARGIHYVLVSQYALTYGPHLTINDLTTKWSATVVEQKNITLMAHVGAEGWYLVKL